MRPVIDYTKSSYFKVLGINNKLKAIEELAAVFMDPDVCVNMDDLNKALIEREKIMSTGIGLGIAIPHVKISAVQKMAFAIGVSMEGIQFDSMDGQPVHIIILVVAGEKQHVEYLKLLSSIIAFIKKDGIKERIIRISSGDEFLTMLQC
jgi:mannitol/fructose-specific phosphotransferase system IIA component (Ntr-type)